MKKKNKSRTMDHGPEKIELMLEDAYQKGLQDGLKEARLQIMNRELGRRTTGRVIPTAKSLFNRLT